MRIYTSMANLYSTSNLLQLATILFILNQYSFAQTTTASDESVDRILKKRGEDAWFLERLAYPPQTYDFGYEVRDLEGNEQYRNEQSDGNRVTGSYGYFGPDGIYRHVDYTADERGFRAQIRTSEPGVAAQNPANVKIITEPLLPQRTPLPGGRILPPIERPSIYYPNIIGDPVLEKGLTYIPNNSGVSTMRGGNAGGSNTGTSTSTSDSDTISGIRRPSSIRGGVGTITGGSRSSSGTSGISSGSKTREDSPIIVVNSRTRGDTSGGSSRNLNIDDLIRSRELLERERELAAREQSLLQRERNAYRDSHNSGVKGGSPYRRYSQISIPAHEFVKRRDSSTKQQDAAMSDASTIDNKEPTDSELVKKNGAASADSSSSMNSSSGSRSDKEENSSSGTISTKESGDRENSLHASVNAIEAMLMNNKQRDGKKGTVKVYISDGPMKESTASALMNSGGSVGNERERETTINTNGMKENDETTTIKSFDSADQQISHLKFDDEQDKIARYRLKSTTVSNTGSSDSYPNSQYGYRSATDNNVAAAIQLKRSYPKNYQQYRLLRSRLPRERPTTRSSTSQNRESIVLTKELVSSSTKDDQTSSTASIDESNSRQQRLSASTKESSNKLRMGRILSSKIISLKDNEQIESRASSAVPTNQAQPTDHKRIHFRTELLPKINIAYNNLIKRTAMFDSSELPEQSNHRQQQNSQTFTQKNSNQTIKNDSTSNLKHLSNALLLTNVSSDRTNGWIGKNSSNSSNENDMASLLPTILKNVLLSSDASSIQETTSPVRLVYNNDETSIRNLTESSEIIDSKLLSPPAITIIKDDSKKSKNTCSSDTSENDRSINSGEDWIKSKSASLRSPLELQLIRLTQSATTGNQI